MMMRRVRKMGMTMMMRRRRRVMMRMRRNAEECDDEEERWLELQLEPASLPRRRE